MLPCTAAVLGTCSSGEVVTPTSLPDERSPDSAISAIELAKFWTTYTRCPSSWIPSGVPGTREPPEIGICVLTPVAGSTRARMPSSLWLTIRREPSGVASMPLSPNVPGIDVHAGPETGIATGVPKPSLS